jgi:hypothetical protein
MLETGRLLLNNGETLGTASLDRNDRRLSLKGLERDYGAGIDDSGDHLDPVAHVMANINI